MPASRSWPPVKISRPEPAAPGGKPTRRALFGLKRVVTRFRSLFHACRNLKTEITFEHHALKLQVKIDLEGVSLGVLGDLPGIRGAEGCTG